MVAQSLNRMLLDRVESRIRELTYGRIRNLAVVEEDGKVVVRGQVPSHHMRQLALQGALELLPGDACCPCITVAS
ncbi:MAG: hypothetical protein KatS3mg108_1790 [Isosphaeraceae bacterium]|jgi:osmotically-inducible protein OsmY|nr:MAG: hypothetical protein KatS3mg108_1790 [Isosphaeraceae bacterium]